MQDQDREWIELMYSIVHADTCARNLSEVLGVDPNKAAAEVRWDVRVAYANRKGIPIPNRGVNRDTESVRTGVITVRDTPHKPNTDPMFTPESVAAARQKIRDDQAQRMREGDKVFTGTGPKGYGWTDMPNRDKFSGGPIPVEASLP